MKARTVAKALAWFGIGLGAVEILAPRTIAQAAGLGDRSSLVRWFGAREVASGILILAARDPLEWLWTRVLGDALDAAVLSSGLRASNPASARALAATALVAPVVILDAVITFRRAP